MNEKRIFMDIHAIQTLPPSNVNRDDTGSPKTAVYGGVRRARVSSQAWKRAMRKYFLENSGAELGVRTLMAPAYIAEQIRKLTPDQSEEEALKMAEAVINKAGVKTKDGKTKALLFLGKKQAGKLAEAAVNGQDNPKELKKLLKGDPDIDIALFGRMVADDPSLNEDASSQVAHAISTHGIQTEFDYFTAIDDLAPENNAGAAMLDTVEYNSSTLYRYANVAVHELEKQLGDKKITIDTLKLFVEAFSNSMPTGKINTFANTTLPQFLLINLRDDRPVNLVSAFEAPVRSKEGYVKGSIRKLTGELNRVEKFVDKPLATIWLAMDAPSDNIDGFEAETMTDLLEKLGTAIEKYI